MRVFEFWNLYWQVLFKFPDWIYIRLYDHDHTDYHTDLVYPLKKPKDFNTQLKFLHAYVLHWTAWRLLPNLFVHMNPDIATLENTLQGHPWEYTAGGQVTLKHSIVKQAYFYPLKIFHLFGFPSWKSSDPKIIGIKTYLFENFSQRKGSRFFWSSKILGEAGKQEICQKMIRKF